MSDFLSVVDPLSGSFATLIRLPKRQLAFGRSRSRDFSQVSNPNQIVGGGSELEDPTHQLQSPVAGFAQQPHSLQPAEDFFYSFALTLTNFITRVARGPLIDRALASLVVLGHVRRHLASAQISDKVFRVVSFVAAQGDSFLFALVVPTSPAPLLVPQCRWPSLCDIGLLLESMADDFDWNLCLGWNKRRINWILSAVGLAQELVDARINNEEIAARSGKMPDWLVPAVLKQWDTPFAINQPPMNHFAPMSSYLHRPRNVFRDLARRWPDPILGTISVNGQFNSLPRFPYQVGNIALRAVKFLWHLPQTGA